MQAVLASRLKGRGPNDRIASLSDRLLQPLSLAQQGILLFDMLAPTGSLEVSRIYRMCGSLDVQRLERSLLAVVDRHEMLRATIDLTSDPWVQRVSPVPRLAFTSRETKGKTSDGPLAAALDVEFLEPRDLGAGPPLCCLLLELQDKHWVLLMTVHHAFIDEWSWQVIEYELSVLYNASSVDPTDDLVSVALQYGDYAAWQQERIDAGQLSHQRAYWTSRLADMQPIAFHTDFEVSSGMDAEPDRVILSVDHELYTEIADLGTASNATPFMVLLTAIKALGLRHTGNGDQTVAVGVAGRNQPETQRTVGYLANYLKVRSSLGGNQAFADALGAVRASTIEAYDHQDLPLISLLEEVPVLAEWQGALFAPGTPRQLGVLVQQISSNGSGALRLDGVEIEPLWDYRSALSSPFDLHIRIADESHLEAGLEVSFIYSRSVFRAETIDRLAAELIEILRRSVADPQATLADLSILEQGDDR